MQSIHRPKVKFSGKLAISENNASTKFYPVAVTQAEPKRKSFSVDSMWIVSFEHNSN